MPFFRVAGAGVSATVAAEAVAMGAVAASLWTAEAEAARQVEDAEAAV